MSDTLNNDVLIRIQQLCDARDWTIYRLAKESEIPYSSLNNIFIRNTCPTVITLKKICDGFNITLSEFFEYNTSVQKNSTELTSTEREIIDKFRTLNRNDKKLFSAYLDGLTKK